MKKHLIALALLGLTAGVASAQSSVTIFGVVDASVRGVKTGDTSTKKLSSDGNSSSRFGFRGTEDLGNGLQAGFWLEAPFSPDNGTGNTSKFFNRRSTVSLIGKQWGEIRLGRDTLAIWNNAAAFDPFGTVGVGTITQLYSALGAQVGTTGSPASLDTKRVDNAVSYFLPGNLGGFYGQLQGSFGESTAGKTDGARLGFKTGGFDIAASVNNIDVLTGSYRQVHAGTSYDFGPAKLWASYVNAKREVAGAADRKLKVWQVGATAKVLEAGTVKAVYGRASDFYSANQWALGYQHDLSKRTALYATYGEIKNKTGDTGAVATFIVPDAPAASTTIAQKSKGYEIGIRHSF